MKIRIAIAPALGGLLLLSMFVQGAAATNATTVPNPPGRVPSPNSSTMSPAEWQELRTARMAALKANPELITKSTQLSEKLRQFEQKLNVAMLKTDPKIATVLAKFAANRPPTSNPTSIPPPSKAR
jgi:hypothetical protein